MPVVKTLNLKLRNCKQPLRFYTCLEEEFCTKYYVDIEFSYNHTNYTAPFLILPKVTNRKILVGRELIKLLASCNKKNIECEINTPRNSKIIEKTYFLPKMLEVGVEKAIGELLKKNFIRNSDSTWLNNIRPVVKPDGSIRVTTNLIALNNLVELDRYSLPHIDRILYNLRGAEWFSKIDLKNGFFQIPLRECDRHKTAFRFKHILYEWNVMPMGFKNAPAVFQRFMDNLLKTEIGKSCIVYVDDILVFGKNEKEHDEALYRVKNLLEKIN